MWTCPKCGEKIEDQFDSCWKCAAQPKQTTIPAHGQPRLRRYFLLGILFDMFLIALVALLPESWLQIEIRNFIVITHTPLLVMLNMGDSVPGAIFVLIFALAVIGVVWGFLIYQATRLVKSLSSRYIVSPRKKLAWKYGLGLLGVIIVSWAVIASLSAVPVQFTASPEIKATVDSNTAFALDLYQKLKGQPGNLFFSPYSISSSLAMTYSGARALTAIEMAGALHFNSSQTNLPSSFAELGERMSRIQRWNRITLLTANSLWGQRDYPFTGPYLDLVHQFFNTEAREVDFVHSPQAAADKINAWVGRQTKGRIQSAFNPNQFNDLTRLVLCNTIYFKGKWQHAFKLGKTKPGDFHVTTNETVTVPMMHQNARFKAVISDHDPVELLELPYLGTDLSMIILLPQTDYPPPDVENPGLPDLEQRLTAENLRAWLAELDQAGGHETYVTMPRFTTSQNLDLMEPLKSLGMKSAFDEKTANFSGMDGTTNLSISDVIHKAYVQVNESGTEAAAVTVQVVKTRSMAERFIVDHPFIFLIRDNGSGSILFMGRIVDPTK
jgi:serpin B